MNSGIPQEFILILSKEEIFKLARNIHKEITENIIKVMEETGSKWTKEWTGGGMPNNPFTGSNYSGINVMQLFAVGHIKGYSSQKWGTYKQLIEKGGKVKKGEKGSPVIFYKTLNIKDRKTEEEKKIPLMKYFTVFNIEQTEGLDEKYFETKVCNSENMPVEEIELFIKNTGAKIKKGNPSFAPTADIIAMPDLKDFTSPEAYYSTFFHELGHWTGHKSRLDRDLNNGFGSNRYAFEELVAELSAVFTCADFAIKSDLENHACYLKSWIKLLKEDDKIIFKASSLASKANKFLVQFMNEKAA